MARSAAAAATAQKAKGLTHIQSMNVIRNMIRVSVSEICYLRNLFPDDMFKERIYADMHIKCLAPQKEKTSKDAEDALLVTRWLEDGVFEALEKKYLETLIFCIYSTSVTKQPHELLESYTYKIQHASSGSTKLATSFTGSNSMDCSPENVKAQAIQMIRSLVSLVNSLDPLPEQRLITIKMIFNSDCPQGWQPKYFERATPEYSSAVASPSLKLSIGKLVTPHHSVVMELEATDVTVDPVSTQASLRDKTTNDDPDELSCKSECDTQPDREDIPELVDDTCPKGKRQLSSGYDSNHTDAFTTPIERTGALSSGATSTDLFSYIFKRGNIDTSRDEFPPLSPGVIKSLVRKLVQGGILRVGVTPESYNVVADCELLKSAINVTHGRMKRHVTEKSLSTALDVPMTTAEALLVWMEQKSLLQRSNGVTNPGYKVIFTESNRATIRAALNAARNAAKAKMQTPRQAKSSSVYEFAEAPSELSVNKVASVKRKTSSQGRGATRPSSCAGTPIFQVRKALKKRRLALNSIG
ncbi:hypothetical protein Poli38472_010428 [Pythium oligandrum]|uniref:HORMA domain-containing protein n=1 Tax=Pythium oligandrum TaxID=41045 RepID=A0A8K1FAY3_PYTOL|nr:hypothetical protein Poli38472_010428 [Pythium oligandrum]|eukprot:TMW55546.1 hypothetical protein Poli38472_010428 [Pythium oligandrum]